MCLVEDDGCGHSIMCELEGVSVSDEQAVTCNDMCHWS